jgi:hypothetical protein
MEIATKPLVMASEISGLEPLHGFKPEVAPRPSLPTLIAARAEKSKSLAAVRTTLPPFDVPADTPTDKPKEAFVWDESKGIE